MPETRPTEKTPTTISDKLKERMKYAVKQENGDTFWGSFKDAVLDSAWLAPIFLLFYIPIERFTHKVLIPSAEKVYRFIKKDPEAQLPEITQSLFKVASTFVWFPALFASKTIRKFVEGPPKQKGVHLQTGEEYLTDEPVSMNAQKGVSVPLTKEQENLAKELSEITQQTGRAPK